MDLAGETYVGLNVETVDWPSNPASSRAAGHSFADKGSHGRALRQRQKGSHVLQSLQHSQKLILE